MANILVTGCTGFIGSHLCRKLIEQGNQVIGFSHSGNTERIPDLEGNCNFELCVGDIQDSERLYEIIKNSDVKTVFHLAAQVPYKNANNLLGVNANGTRKLLSVAYANDVEEFIYASSMGVYSVPPENLPVSESHSTKPDTEYGQTKLMGEFACKSMSKSIKTMIVRYAGAYGSGMEPNRVIPLFVRAALSGKPLEVLGDGKQSSDFCYVGDIVDGTIRAWQKGESGNVYNIGSGVDIRLRDLARTIVEITHSKSEIKILDNKIDRPFRFYLDIGKARNELDYEPVYPIDGLAWFVRDTRRMVNIDG